MKNSLFCIPLFLFSFQCFSQQGNYKITYRHNVQLDTTQVLRDTIGRTATLIGNSNEANYSFSKAVLLPTQNTQNVKKFEDILNAKQSGQAIIKSGIPFDSIGNMVFQNKKNKTISVREKMGNEYVVTEETIPKINWKITDETKNIKTYQCKKATTHFRGRDYTAWFTTDVPIVAAPWKFLGLPGLLMDIEDSKHQVKIYVEKIEFPTVEKVPDFVSKGTKVTLEKYVAFRNEEDKKMVQGMEVILMQQDHMQELIDKGLVKRPTVRSKGAMYCIETRLD